MEIKKLLPYKTALNIEDFKTVTTDIIKKKSFCIESYYAYLDRHKNSIDKEQVIEVFKHYPQLLALEFIREFLRNYFQINGTLKLNIYNVATLHNIEVKKQIYNNLKEDLYVPIYKNSLNGRLYTDYQSWGNVIKNGKEIHLLEHLSGEEIFSVDVRSCILTIYINFMKMNGYKIDQTYELFYRKDFDFYLYFVLKTFLPNLVDRENNFFLEEVKEHFKNQKDTVRELASFLNLDARKYKIIDILRESGKKIIIPLLFQGKDILLNKFAKIMGYNKNKMEHCVYGKHSVLQFGEWNKYIYDFVNGYKSSSILKKFYSLYVPHYSYLKDEKKISAYILDNIANHSIYNSIIKLLLAGIEIKGYFFDEIYIPIRYKNRLEEIKKIFLENNLVSLKISDK